MKPDEFLKEVEILERQYNVEFVKRYQKCSDGTYKVFGPGMTSNQKVAILGVETLEDTLILYKSWIEKFINKKEG